MWRPRLKYALILTLIGGSVRADMVVAVRTIKPQTILAATDLTLNDQDMAGTFARIEDLIGSETRVILYAGRPILPEDVGPPALIERNQIVPLLYTKGDLTIRAEGRALGRGALGDPLRVMNLQSRSPVQGVVRPDGSVLVN